MSKKNYQKPLAEYIAFYSDEEIASTLPLADYATRSGNEITGGVSGGGWTEEPGEDFE